jgi:hypothetical protein
MAKTDYDGHGKDMDTKPETLKIFRVIYVSLVMIFCDVLGSRMIVDDQKRKKPLSGSGRETIRAKAFKTLLGTCF